MAYGLPSDQPPLTVRLSETHAVELPTDDTLILHAYGVAITLTQEEFYKLYLLLHSLFQADNGSWVGGCVSCNASPPVFPPAHGMQEEDIWLLERDWDKKGNSR